MTQLAFSDEFRERLSYGKYTRWAVDLSPDHLEALLWMVGEFAFRSDSILAVLDAQHGSDRGVIALQAIDAMAAGERFNEYDWGSRLISGRGPQCQGSCRLGGARA